jgi:hypothetical protein
MVIANPIYDIVFKRLMENDRVAKFFIGTLLEENIEAVEVKPQEFTYLKNIEKSSPDKKRLINEQIKEQLSINFFRLDFIATILTETGVRKKVLIEIQKVKNNIDLMRFRNYLGEQYKREDIINNEKHILPITTIYILGFNLPEIETACIKVERNYKDLIARKIINRKCDFVERLTHDCFIVQVNRITEGYQTSLDKILSIFEQSNFLDGGKIIKDFKHKIENEDLKMVTDILHHTGVDPEQKKLIEIEQEAWRSINALLEDQERGYIKAIVEKDIALVEKDKTIGEKDRTIGEKDIALGKKDKELDQMAKELMEKNKIIEDLKKR